VQQGLTAYRAGFPDFDLAIKLDPNYAPVRRHRGNTIIATYKALKALGKPTNGILDRAIDDLKAAVTLDPASKANANALGEGYLVKGSYDLAIESFKNAIQRDKTYAAPYSGLCTAYKLAGNLSEANRYAKLAAELDDGLKSKPCLTRKI